MEDVLEVGSVPVRGDLVLGGGKIEFAGADEVVEGVFERVLLMEAGAWFGGLREQVRDVVGAAQFEGDDVVDFVFARGVMRDVVGGETLFLVVVVTLRTLLL